MRLYNSPQPLCARCAASIGEGIALETKWLRKVGIAVRGMTNVAGVISFGGLGSFPWVGWGHFLWWGNYFSREMQWDNFRGAP